MQIVAASVIFFGVWFVWKKRKQIVQLTTLALADISSIWSEYAKKIHLWVAENVGWGKLRWKIVFCRNINPAPFTSSETGSLDRLKSAAERRKKCSLDDHGPAVSGRVEGTRVNPVFMVDEIVKNTKLDQLEESAESKWDVIFLGFRRNNKFKEKICGFFMSSCSLWAKALYCPGWIHITWQS